MAIKVAPRAQISEEFIRAFKEITRKRVGEIENYIKNLPPVQQARAKTQAEQTLKRLAGINAGTHLDFELTKLKTLEYTSFEVEVVRDADGQKVPYLVGKTKDVIIRSGSTKWLMGPYAVCLPMKALIQGQTAGFQMYPMVAPLERERHPHHHSYSSSSHPLMMRPSTCWGGFGAIVSMMTQDCDIPELYRTISTYLGRYDAGSPLVRLDYITFKRAIK